MTKKFLKNKKGITLVSLSIVVIVLMIITGVIIYDVGNNLKIEKLKNMQNDIENLRDKVETYYAQYGALPISEEYTETSGIDAISVNDTGKFYVIDLRAMENITLTYGEDYEEVGTVRDVNTLKDIFIINEDSHNIFYVNGITIDNETYYTTYTNNEKDKQEVTMHKDDL